jgi:TPR repeat protein
MIQHTTKDMTEAVRLIHVGVNHGIPQAEHQLAILYEYGYGVKQDFQMAMKYYQSAAEKKYIESIYHLGLMYSSGRGTAVSYPMAQSLFEFGARNDHPASTFYLVNLFKMIYL